jgi:hypothetical protein
MYKTNLKPFLDNKNSYTQQLTKLIYKSTFHQIVFGTFLTLFEMYIDIGSTGIITLDFSGSYACNTSYACGTRWVV